MRHGFLLIDKPVGPTSHDVVGTVRRTLGERSIGHLGTLDPLASGLMVLAVGRKALKVVEFFNDLPKSYDAVLQCGAVSTTYDMEGVIEELPRKAGWEPPVDASRIQALIDDHFVGKIHQVPPAYSAVSIGGERAYRKARRGEAVELPGRDVTISSCTIVHYAYPRITLRVTCEAGTYIRSLAHDLGHKLGCGAYLTALRRTQVGDWPLDDAVSLDAVTWTSVLPLKDVLQSFPQRVLTDDEWEHLQHGRLINGTCKPVTVAWYDDLPVAILEESHKFPGKIKPRKVL